MTAQTLSEYLEYLTPDEQQFVTQVLAHNHVLWEPLPGPQTLAYETDADVVGYGGAAGGGKTDLALGKALNRHKRIAVFRLNGTEHTAFIDRLEEVLGTRDGFNGQAGIWRNAGPRKVQLELGSVPNMGDEKKYRGRPHDLKVFDEAAEIPEIQVRFLMGWMRTTDPTQKCQTLMCFNPPTTAQGRWVIDFFAPWLDPKHPDPAMPGELRYFASIDGKDVEVKDGKPFTHNNELILPQSRTFIPARVTDNPYLVNTSYMTTLQALPEPLRSQMLYGDFQAGVEDDAMQVIPTAWVDAAMARWKPKDKLPPMEGVGVDVARGGKDNTIIARRHEGMWFDKPLVYPGTQTPDGPTAAALVIAATRDQAPQHIDIIGVGSAVYDFLVDSKQPAIGINVSEAAGGTDKSGRLRFANQRSELYWRMREALDPVNNTGIALPPDKRLRADLCAPIWRLRGSAIQVESREDIIKRIKRSPDWASAYLLGLIETPKISYLKSLQPQQYDPYAECTRETRRTEYNPYSNL